MKRDGSLGLDSEPRVDPLRAPSISCLALLQLHPLHRPCDSSTATTATTAPTPSTPLMTVNPRRRHPPRSRLGSHLLSPQLLDDIAQTQPHHPNRDRRPFARDFVVDGHFDLVRLVDVDLEILVPPIRPRRMRARARRVLNFDVDDGFGGVFGLFGLRSVGEVAG